MVKKFEEYTNGYGFLVPSQAGPEGNIPMAPFGDEHKITSFKDFQFSEYRKGSNKFGGLINDIMMFLRLYKEDRNKKSLKFKRDEFEKGANIKIEDIIQLLNSGVNLLSFNIKIDDEYITFKNLNKAYKSRFVWGENKNQE